MVSGAGDTCVATVFLAWLQDWSHYWLVSLAMRLRVLLCANGTSVVYAQELEARFRQLGYEA